LADCRIGGLSGLLISRTTPPMLRIALVIATLAAAGYTGRLAIYMFDESRTSYSVLDRDFFRNHSCLSSYTEAARLAPTGANIFDPAVYSEVASDGGRGTRHIGSFEVDLYQYPPPFLVLPALAERLGLGFLAVRTLWFLILMTILVGSLVLTASWIGGTRGAIAAMFIPMMFLAPTTRVALQSGNFQVTAFPLAMLAMIAFFKFRPASAGTALGGIALGFCAVSKIYPGVLGIVLLVQRRWTAVAATVASGAVITAVALGAVGTKPFLDFRDSQSRILCLRPTVDGGCGHRRAAAAAADRRVRGRIADQAASRPTVAWSLESRVLPQPLRA